MEGAAQRKGSELWEGWASGRLVSHSSGWASGQVVSHRRGAGGQGVSHGREKAGRGELQLGGTVN